MVEKLVMLRNVDTRSTGLIFTQLYTHAMHITVRDLQSDLIRVTAIQVCTKTVRNRWQENKLRSGRPFRKLRLTLDPKWTFHTPIDLIGTAGRMNAAQYIEYFFENNVVSAGSHAVRRFLFQDEIASIHIKDQTRQFPNNIKFEFWTSQLLSQISIRSSLCGMRWIGSSETNVWLQKLFNGFCYLFMRRMGQHTPRGLSRGWLKV